MVSATERTPLNAGAQLRHETQLANVVSILWVENQLFCSCDEEGLQISLFFYIWA